MSERTRTIQWEDPLIQAHNARQMNGRDFFQAWLDGKYPPIGTLMDFELAEVGMVTS